MTYAAFPPSKKQPVLDEYHGVKVTDDYRWLEDGDSAEVNAWTNTQNEHSRSALDALPDREAIEKKLTELFGKMSASYFALKPRDKRLFALKFDPPKQQPLLVFMNSADDPKSEQVVLNPNEMEPLGQVTVDWYQPSPDGKLVAASISMHGSEVGALHFYDAETGRALPDVISRVQIPTAGGSVAWTNDGKRVFYTRYPRDGERAEADMRFYQKVYMHTLGTPESADKFSLGKDFPRIAETDLETSADGHWLVATVSDGDGGEHAHYVLDLRGEDPTAWWKVTQFKDHVKQVVVSHDGKSLFLRAVKDAPHGRVLQLPLDGKARLADAKVVVPESDAVIDQIEPTASYLYVNDLVGGPSRVRRFDLDGKNMAEVPIAKNSAASGLLPLDGDKVLFRTMSYTQPGTWVIYDPASGEVRKTALADEPPVDFSDIETVREFAVSKDGTKIPVNILMRKGTKLNGNNPTLLYAYGGYGISLRPSFDFTRRLWFDRGGIAVVANIRGGGEYGEEWHLNGNLTKKQNVFDDFAACARHLIERGYTSREKLAFEGGSNGGLLMGAMFTQHPDLARAVVAHVGIYDMLRVELDPNGAFNVTEFGTVKDPVQFRALHAYSPLHHVVDGTKYPALFLLAGAHDGRVNPAHSRKFAARVQAATAPENPVLLRISGASGHGIGTALTERIAQKADVTAFLFDQLQMKPAR